MHFTIPVCRYKTQKSRDAFSRWASTRLRMMERRRDHLVDRHSKEAGFRDVKTLDTFNSSFNAIDRAQIYELAT